MTKYVLITESQVPVNFADSKTNNAPGEAETSPGAFYFNLTLKT